MCYIFMTITDKMQKGKATEMDDVKQIMDEMKQINEHVKQINEDVIKKCFEFLNDYLEGYRSDPESEWIKEYFSQYNYTVDVFIEELRKAALIGLKRELKCLNPTRLSRLSDKTVEDQSKYFFWFMRQMMRRRIEHKWFNFEREPQASIEYSLTNAGKNCDYFRELVPRIFKFHREAKQGIHGAHVMGDLPILFFGNLRKYLHSDIRILTLGRMPPCDEFSGEVKRFRESEPEHDYTQFFRPIPMPWEVNIYLGVCNSYFRRNPNWGYFKKFTPLLEELLGSYICEPDQQESSKKKYLTMWDELRFPCNIAVHFNVNTPLVLDTPWEHLEGNARAAFSLEEEFPKTLDVLNPDIIICDFDIRETCLAKNAKKATIPQDWELSEKYMNVPAYSFGEDKYILEIS